MSGADTPGRADPALRVLAFGDLPSTQDEVRRRLGAGEAVHGLVVRARCQTGGRGQRARDWLSGEGGSYQTLAVRSLHAPPAAALVLALGVAEALLDGGVRVGIKWPNDLFYRHKKLAGLLVEAVQGHLLIGVGVNVANPVPPGGAALRGWDVEAVHELVLSGLQLGLTHLTNPQFNLPAAFSPFDLLAGREVQLATASGLRAGTACGVDATGRLCVRGADGAVTALSGRLQRLRFP